MGKPRVPLDPVADLKRRLGRASTDQARVRSCMHRWCSDHDLADHPAVVGKRIAIALIEQPMTEDKLAGILMLQEVFGDQLRAADVSAFARLFARGHLADATIVDWFALKVLATLLDRAPGRADTARQLAQWRSADTTWQRRAACLAFTRLAGQGDAALPGLGELACTICATVVWSHERFDQTAVAVLLRELSRADPARVEQFVLRHALLMSKETVRAAVAKLPPDKRAALLAHHRRATSLRNA
jgi:3-methyladenine DNA glycosylase AlkD